VAGRALKRSDGLLLAMLGLRVGDVAFEGFIHGHLIGREEERQRTGNSFMTFWAQSFLWHLSLHTKQVKL
jgi:hypothetical protein